MARGYRDEDDEDEFRNRRRGRDDDDDGDDRDRGRGGSKKKKKDSANIEIRLENVRLSFSHLWKPKAFDGDDDDSSAAYQASFILDPKKHRDKIEEIEDAIESVKEAKWKDKPPKLKADRIPLREGDDMNDPGPEYEGMLYVAARNSKKPQVIDRDHSPLSPEDGKPYNGCYVNAIVRIWAQDNKYGKRINASLEAVQYFAKGEAFGAAPVDTSRAFERYDDEDRGSRRRSRGDDDDDRPSRRSRGDDDDDRPRRRSRDDDDDDKPRRRSRDDEDDRPSRRSRDDDDDRPRRRGRDDDDGEERPRRPRRDLVDD